MVELKTINNIPVYILSPENCSILSDEDGDFKRITVSKSELKQEAMKQLDYKFKMAMNEKNEGIKEFLLGQCAFIEEFFDLEDLE